MPSVINFIGLLLFSQQFHSISTQTSIRCNVSIQSFAMQLCYLRYPRHALGADANAGPWLLAFVGQQLRINIGSWDGYGQRDQTSRGHLATIIETYGFQQFSTSHYRKYADWLLPLATPDLLVEHSQSGLPANTAALAVIST
jgi:hypothetical protein